MEDKNSKKRLERIDKKIDSVERRIESLMAGVKDDELAPLDRMEVAIKLLGHYIRLEKLRQETELELNIDDNRDKKLFALFLRGEEVEDGS